MDSETAAKELIAYLYSLARAAESGTPGRSDFLKRTITPPDARAALAHLRRGVGKEPGYAVETLPHVVPFLPETCSPWERTCFFLVASVFAEHPTPYTENTNMGDVMKALGEHESAQKRFAALLDCTEDRLPYHIRQAVRMAAGKEIPINYGRLLFHLMEWTHPDRWVQFLWARSYWRPTPETKQTDTPEKNGEQE